MEIIEMQKGSNFDFLMMMAVEKKYNGIIKKTVRKFINKGELLNNIIRNSIPENDMAPRTIKITADKLSKIAGNRST